MFDYPERAAGGFTRADDTVAFYQRVQTLAEPGSVVLDFGAGRGRAVENTVKLRRELQDLRGQGRHVIGVDVDPVVLTNPLLHEAHVLTGPVLPLPDASVDVVVSDWVLEHVDDPEAVAAEFRRVLKPGGWLCARTPNRLGYIALGARLIPNSWHQRFLARLQPHRKSVDVFPTRYRMNTAGAIRRLLPDFDHHSYGHHPEPSYFGKGKAKLAMCAVTRVLPERFAAVLMVFARKPDVLDPRSSAHSEPLAAARGSG